MSGAVSGAVSRIGVYPGTFDPVTLGHMDIIRRGATLVDRLVDAVALARRQGANLRLVVAGDGPERGALERRIADAGLAGCCDLLGFVPDPAPLYAEFDLFALSSDTEQMPIALLEAMAAARPAVATDVGDVRAILQAHADEQVVA